MTSPQPQLKMRRPNLDGLGEAPTVPEGYTLRVARNADDEGVARVLAMSFEDASWTIQKVHDELLDHAFVDCTFVIEFEGSVVATASAQLPRQEGDTTGWVHWVGADSAHRGKKLGFIVCDAVLRRHAELGYTGASLTTDDHRLPAITTYLKLGFEPWHVDESHPDRWKLVLEKLGR